MSDRWRLHDGASRWLGNHTTVMDHQFTGLEMIFLFFFECSLLCVGFFSFVFLFFSFPWNFRTTNSLI